MILDQTKKVLVGSFGLLTVGGVVLADDVTSGYSGIETVDAPQVEQKLRLNPGFTYSSAADFDKSSLGDVSVWRMDIPARYTIKMEQGEVGLGGFYEYSEYDFSDLGGIKKFNTLAFNAYWKAMINDNWGYFVIGGGAFSSSTKTAITKGGTAFGAGGVTYSFCPHLTVGLGAGVATQLEDDPTGIPVIIVNWQINEDWSLKVLNGATLSYDISHEKKFILDAGANYRRRQYQTDGDGAVIDENVTVELGATYNFSPTFGLRGFVGVSAARNIEIRHNNDKVTDQDVDPGPYVGVRALLTF